MNFGRKWSFDVGDTVNGEREIFGSAPFIYSPAGSQWEFRSNKIKVSSIEILQMDFQPWKVIHTQQRLEIQFGIFENSHHLEVFDAAATFHFAIFVESLVVFIQIVKGIYLDFKMNLFNS